MAEEKESLKLTWVLPGDACEKFKVALWERHPEHPAADKYDDFGEVYIHNDPGVTEPTQVAITPLVLDRLRTGFLKEVPAPKAEEAPKPSALKPS